MVEYEYGKSPEGPWNSWHIWNILNQKR